MFQPFTGKCPTDFVEDPEILSIDIGLVLTKKQLSATV
jgi:hypothetical protein